MDNLQPYALCVQTNDRHLVPIIRGNVNQLGLYKLVMQLSDFRSLMPQFLLVVNHHIVSRVDFTREGMRLVGQPLEELGYAD